MKKVKFVVIINDISNVVDKLVGEMILGSLKTEFETRKEVGVEGVRLSNLIGVEIMPDCLLNQCSYDKIVLICEKNTATFFLDVCEIIHNAELWVCNWGERHLFSINKTGENKIFYTDQEIIDEALSLVSAPSSKRSAA